ncbi:MAG: transporter substrate-binding domain-containing protein, partial [Planctomycetes bacterium]|nr:transporter substrate-binding domain-containing protein [Planctomycetota bacterium]
PRHRLVQAHYLAAAFAAMPVHSDSDQDVREELLQAVGQGDFTRALDVVRRFASDGDCALLRQRLTEINSQARQGLLTVEKATALRLKLSHDILDYALPTRVQRRRTRRRLLACAFALLSCSAFGALIYHLSRKPDGPIVAAERVYLGKKIFLDWSTDYPDSVNTPNYEVCGTRLGDDGNCTQQEIATYSVRNRNFMVPRDMNNSSCWRVRRLNDDGTPATKFSAPAVVTQYASIKARQQRLCTLTVAMPDSYSRTFMDFVIADDAEKEGGRDGLEIQLVNELARQVSPSTCKNAFEVTVLRMPWADVLRATGRGEVDIGIGSITALADREATYSIRFSLPYFFTTMALLTSRPVEKDIDLGNYLDTHTVGIQNGSSHHMFLDTHFAEHRKRMVFYAQIELAIQAMLGPESPVDAIITDEAYAYGHARVHGLSPDCVVVPNLPETLSHLASQPYGAAVPASDGAFLAEVDGIISQLVASGWLERATTLARTGFLESDNK